MMLRRVIMELLADPNVDRRWGFAEDYFHKDVIGRVGQHLEAAQVLEALWQLVAEGLVYADYSKPEVENWKWCLSERGRRVVQTEDEFEPDDEEGYLERLRGRMPDLDRDILCYATEAVRSFGARCYLATSVMLGVSSEKAVLLLAEAACHWLPQAEAAALRKVVENPRNHFLAKFQEFRKRVEPHKGNLPAEIGDNLSLVLDAVADLLRVYRNEAGHPTGKEVERDDARIYLAIFPTYLQRIWLMKKLFEETQL